MNHHYGGGAGGGQSNHHHQGGNRQRGPPTIHTLLPVVPQNQEPIQSATDYFQEMVDKVTRNLPEKTEKSFEYWLGRTNKAPCKMHPSKLSKTCRFCKEIAEAIEKCKGDDVRDEERKTTDLQKVFNTNKNQNGGSTSANNPNTSMTVHGDYITFNLPPVLRDSIMHSRYFAELASNARSIEQLIEEVLKNVRHVEPWVQSGISTPSVFFCCLLRLLLMRPSENQLTSLADSKVSPFVRCLALLAFRFISDPERLWSVLGRHADSDEKFTPTVLGDKEITIGNYVQALLGDYSYYGTRLPRIPTMIERDIKDKLGELEVRRERLAWNQQNIREFTEGSMLNVLSAQTKSWRKATLKFINGDNARVMFESTEADDAMMQLEMLEAQFEKGNKQFELKKEETIHLSNVVLLASRMKEEPKPIASNLTKNNTSIKDEQKQIAQAADKPKRGNRRSTSSKSSTGSSSSPSRSKSSSKQVKKGRNDKKQDQGVRNRKRSRSRSDSREENGRNKKKSDQVREKINKTSKPIRKRKRSSSSSSRSSSKSSISSLIREDRDRNRPGSKVNIKKVVPSKSKNSDSLKTKKTKHKSKASSNSSRSSSSSSSSGSSSSSSGSSSSSKSAKAGQSKKDVATLYGGEAAASKLRSRIDDGDRLYSKVLDESADVVVLGKK